MQGFPVVLLNMSYNSKDEHAFVSIGIPGKILSRDAEEEINPCVSKIGGKPVWHDASTAPSAKLSCRICGSSESVLMVAQIYAPTDRDRSLYIFCCDNRECSLKR